MINKGLFSTFFIERIREKVSLDDFAKGRMATLTQTWKMCDRTNTNGLWNTFLKQALSYLQFVPVNTPLSPGVYKLYEDWGFSNCISVVYLIEPGADIDDMAIGRFSPAKLLLRLKEFNLNWGILTDGSKWRLYSAKSSRPYEDYVELELAKSLGRSDEKEYCLFESFFHKDSFIPKIEDKPKQKYGNESASTLLTCQLEQYRKDSEEALDEYVKKPLLYQIDEVLQYLCNGFIFDTPRKGEEYTEEERKEIFENSVKLLYRCLFLFYAEARKLLPSEAEKSEVYERHSLESLCYEAHKFQWGKRTDTDGYDLWMQFKGLINAVNEGDPEYGIMGYNGGLFDDTKERFLGKHRLRNDFFSRALYLLSYFEPQDRDPDKEYKIPYEDLEVRHLGELYENILEYTVLLADADRIRRRTKKGFDIILASETVKQKGDTLIQKGDVYFGESALERKQTGSYYTPEPIVQFLNKKTVIEPLREKFEGEYRSRFEEFLEQANSGYDDITKRGASRSALALIKRFVDEVILEFKVCDPAMGSGHFLVDAVNQMTGLVVELLAELPEIDVTTDDITSNPNYWRRMITRHCLYGVDLNPLAVDLAKLSLWLNCFAVDHKLTFLDHHLRCGNSLIGIKAIEQLRSIPKKRRESLIHSKQNELPHFDNLFEKYLQSATAIENIKTIDEDNLEFQKDSFEKSNMISEKDLSPLADLLSAYLINNDIKEEEFIELFHYLSGGNRSSEKFGYHLQEIWNSIKNLKEKHQFFHWTLKFPDVFSKEGDGGFHATIGNPPWDVLQPNTQEFYSKYIPEFRKYNKQAAMKKINELHQEHPEIEERWSGYAENFRELTCYLKEPTQYFALASGKVDLYKAFLERAFQLLRKNGNLGILVPSGFYTDKSCEPLRKLFFQNSDINCIYSFENRWPTVFNAVDGRFKFTLFSAKKNGKTLSFKCAFMQHDPSRLTDIDKNAINMNLEQVKRFSPNVLSVLEIESLKSLEIVDKCYSENLTYEDLDDLSLYQELNVTSDAAHLNENEDGLPLWEGKNIWLYNWLFEKPRYWINNEKAKGFLERKYGKNSSKGPDFFRLCFRGVAAATNERTLIASIIPQSILCEVKCTCVDVDGDYNRLSFLMKLLSIMCSFVQDFCIRYRVTSNVNIFHILQLPLPRSIFENQEFLVARTARLCCTDPKFSRMWLDVFAPEWKNPDFWYPFSSGEFIEYNSYGPEHEREIRRKIAESSQGLEKKWSISSGLYNRTPDRRDIGDRAQLRAEIDAYIAHLYGLGRNDFSYILNTFPVLRRKEKEAFGEYMSKRKCLEEYDRIATIL